MTGPRSLPSGGAAPRSDAGLYGRRLRSCGAVLVASLILVTGCTSYGDSTPTSAGASDSGQTLPPEQTEQSGSAPSELPSSVPAPATTAVPAPGGGDINQTVTTGEITSNSPVPLTQTGTDTDGVSVSLTGVEGITTEANLPGEIAGPGIKVTVAIRNGSSEPLDLSNVVVDLQDATQTPAIPITTGSTPFAGSLAAGADASGVYVFTTPTNYSDPATIAVTYNATEPVAVFVGNVQ